VTVIQFPGSSISFSQIAQAFSDAMKKRGMIPPLKIIDDGKIHRCDVDGKRGKGDGAYLLFATGKIPAGGFQNHKDGLGWENWSYDLGRQTLTAVEQRELQLKRATTARERAEKDAQDIVAAQQKAERIWSRAREATEHPYLDRKRVAPNGARIVHTALVIPARTVDGDLRGLQFISADGKKLWMTGSRPTGAFYRVGAAHDALERVVITEGFATAASIHAATGDTVLVAFSCGNLKPVAEAAHQKYPPAEIIIAADDDRGTKGNPGIRDAIAAAIEVGGTVADPGSALVDKETDFNDIAVRLGDDAVREIFKSASTPAKVLERRLVANPFSAFEDENVKAVIAVKEHDRAAFEQLRGCLKQAGARVSELDKLWGVPAESEDAPKVDKKQADILVRLAGSAVLFHTHDGTVYADVDRDGHRETYPIYGRDFRRWLKHRFYEETGSSPGGETFAAALGTIESKAAFEGAEQEVHLRIAGHDGNIYMDLGDADWRAIEVSPTGWRITSDPPVRFRRSGTMLPLPSPVNGGRISDLRPFLNVPDDDAFVLTVAYILAAARPQGPYPLISLHGPAGTAKSTFSEVVRRLIDRGKPALRSLPREKEDFFIAANNSHVLAFENIGYIPPWISDLMCMCATGGGYSRRELYTDMGETVFDAQRPQILNGIEDFVVRGDLADRAIPLLLETIPEGKRRHEGEFWAAFDTAAPRILGALLDAVANGLRHLPTTNPPLLPRMADFALWATACETGAPWVQGLRFMDAYARNRAEATRVVLEDDIVARALRKVMANNNKVTGTATELLARLTETWNGSPPEKWPKAPHKLSNRIRRIMPQLATTGLTVVFDRIGETRTITVTRGEYIPSPLHKVSPESSVISVVSVISKENQGVNEAPPSVIKRQPSVSQASAKDTHDATDAGPSSSVIQKAQPYQR
jgi:phage/plasmid primase-like uncharacterized protein